MNKLIESHVSTWFDKQPELIRRQFLKDFYHQKLDQHDGDLRTKINVFLNTVNVNYDKTIKMLGANAHAFTVFLGNKLPNK